MHGSYCVDACACVMDVITFVVLSTVLTGRCMQAIEELCEGFPHVSQCSGGLQCVGLGYVLPCMENEIHRCIMWCVAMLM